MKAIFDPGEHPDYLIVALGNPGKSFENTRQNVSVNAIQYLHDNCHYHNNFNNLAYCALTDVCVFEGCMVAMGISQVFMNNSGMVVKDLLDYYRLRESKLIIIHDNPKIPYGKFNVINSKNSFGHKGIESIIEHIGKVEFVRIEIGTGSENLIDERYNSRTSFTEEEIERCAEWFPKLYEVVKALLTKYFSDAEKLIEEFFPTLEEEASK